MSKARELSELGDKITVDGSGNSTFDGDVAAANLSTTGNVTVTGTVDGRDVAADGTKLDGIASGAEVNAVDSVNTQTGAVVLDADDISDTTTTNKFTTAADISKLAGIEANATADQTATEIKTAYESNANTNAYTDAEKSKLAGIETGADVTDATNVTAAGALMDSEVTNLAAVKAFDPTDYATAAQGSLADSAVQPNDSPTFAGGAFAGNVSFGDNDFLYFGASNDLHIYHDGSNSLIRDTGTGDLQLRGSHIALMDAGGNHFIYCTDTGTGGTVEIKHLGATKLATTSSGVSITGTVAATSFTGDGSNLTGISTDPYDSDTSSTGYFSLPRGTTAQRPSSPQNGYIRYNTTIGGIEEYRSGSWFTLSAVFTTATGGSVTTSGSYTIHTFTSSGTFTVDGTVSIEYLVIGGGGGGATQANSDNRGGGGGGAGGYRTNVSGQTSGGNSSAEASKTLTAGSYTVTVGAGGAGGSGGYYAYGSSGSTSTIDSVASSSGGGRGGHGNGGNPSSGGSGGGGGSGASPTNGASGTSGQGFGGGNGTSSGSHTGGTGGGAGGAGTNAQSGLGIRRAGGAGLSSNITGSSVTRAVGGGSINADNEQSGGANTGTGGDGGGGTSAGSGGSGIVIIRYLTP